MKLCKPRIDITIEYIKSILDYNPTTGIFTWKITTGPRSIAGSIAGSVHNKDGKRRIIINKKPAYASNLAWVIMYGVWPNYEVDHVNRIKNDDRWVNLRPSNRSQNKANNNVYSNNTSGFPGVSRCGSKWKAQISVFGKMMHLGVYSSPEEAYQMYKKEKVRIHGEFASIL